MLCNSCTCMLEPYSLPSLPMLAEEENSPQKLTSQVN